MTDVIALLSFTIAIGGTGIVILIYHNQSKQSNKIEELTTDIHIYVEEQKKKERRLQTGYARVVLSLINYTRMSIHGINVQIKFLKVLYSQQSTKYMLTKEQLEEEKDRRKQVESYLNELRNTMTRSSITSEIILELFDEPTQLLYDKMWKMFVFTHSVFAMGEDFYESLMSFINIGVKASEELHETMLEFIPESQKNGFTLQKVDAT